MIHTKVKHGKTTGAPTVKTKSCDLVAINFRPSHNTAAPASDFWMANHLFRVYPKMFHDCMVNCNFHKISMLRSDKNPDKYLDSNQSEGSKNHGKAWKGWVALVKEDIDSEQ